MSHKVRHVSDTDGPPNDWARLVKELSDRPGWNQARLAREVHVDRRTIGRWIKGTSVNVTGESMRLLADATGIDYQLVARAAIGTQRQAYDDDDEAIRDVLESNLAETLKREIVDYIRKRRDDEEAKLRRDIDLMLRSHRQAS